MQARPQSTARSLPRAEEKHAPPHTRTRACTHEHTHAHPRGNQEREGRGWAEKPSKSLVMSHACHKQATSPGLAVAPATVMWLTPALWWPHRNLAFSSGTFCDSGRMARETVLWNTI